MGETFNMTKIDDNWILNYTVPDVIDGAYSLLFTATDLRGNQGTLQRTLVVDSAPPTVSGSLSPNIVKSGDIINIEAFSDNADYIDALINGESVSLANWDRMDGMVLIQFLRLQMEFKPFI